MLSPDLFSKLEQIARRLRGVDSFFGGVRIVCVGDFFQLPPCGDMMLDPSVRNTYGNDSVRRVDREYLFGGQSWVEGDFKMVTLSTSWRHRDDPDMAELLR